MKILEQEFRGTTVLEWILRGTVVSMIILFVVLLLGVKPLVPVIVAGINLTTAFAVVYYIFCKS